MFMRIFSVALGLLLAGCGGGESNGPAPLAGADRDEIPPKTLCALNGSDSFERDCVLERESVDGALTLLLRHPDGGFRRLRVTSDGRGVIAADGSETASVSTIGTNMIEVGIEGDRYRLPATVEPVG